MAERNTILIIDDDSRNIFALKAVLKTKGYIVTSATEVREGLNILLQDSSIGIVLMDMMMPDIDGYEAMKLLREQLGTANIPVVAVTPQAMVGDGEKCLAAGATAYISKPVDVDVLLELLNEHLG